MITEYYSSRLSPITNKAASRWTPKNNLFIRSNVMIYDAIVELIVEQTECDPAEVTMDSKFVDLGIDSLDTVEMIMNLEDKVGFEIELDQKIETVGDLVKFVESKRPQ